MRRPGLPKIARHWPILMNFKVEVQKFRLRRAKQEFLLYSKFVLEILHLEIMVGHLGTMVNFSCDHTCVRKFGNCVMCCVCDAQISSHTKLC